MTRYYYEIQDKTGPIDAGFIEASDVKAAQAILGDKAASLKGTGTLGPSLDTIKQVCDKIHVRAVSPAQ